MVFFAGQLSLETRKQPSGGHVRGGSATGQTTLASHVYTIDVHPPLMRTRH